MNLDKEFWKNYYQNNNIISRSDNYQQNVSRSRSGIIIKDKDWHQTLSYIKSILKISKESDILELCCGNGLIIGELSEMCNTAVAIDYSDSLLKQLKQMYKANNLTVIQEDINEILLDKSSFDAIIMYFSIQHFDLKETIAIIKKCITSLKNGGLMLIGDIPDNSKKWSYLSKDEYKIDYIERIYKNEPKIGTWFEKEFFVALNLYFKEVNILIYDQPSYQINSDYRFDVVIEKL